MVDVVVPEFVEPEVLRGLPAEITGEGLVVRLRLPADEAPPQDAVWAAARISLTDLRVIRDPADRSGIEGVECARAGVGNGSALRLDSKFPYGIITPYRSMNSSIE